MTPKEWLTQEIDRIAEALETPDRSELLLVELKALGMATHLLTLQVANSEFFNTRVGADYRIAMRVKLDSIAERVRILNKEFEELNNKNVLRAKMEAYIKELRHQDLEND